MPLFSVIIPVYNAAHTIERCVDSLIACGGDVQIILVEDCSRDNSWEVCRKLAAQHENVICRHNEVNKGVSYTRNRGLALAEGTYLLFTDSDDWVDPDYISAFSQAAKSGTQLAICGYINHDEKQNRRTETCAWQDFVGTREIVLREEIETLYGRCLLQQLWNKLFVNAIVQKNQIRFDETISIGEDTRFVLDYIAAADLDKALLINRPLYHYMRDQAGSLMFRIGSESVEEPLKNLRKLYTIQGLEGQALEQRLDADRKKQTELYAYLIMHNMGMKLAEKRRRILSLDPSQGRRLYRKNCALRVKEFIFKLFR